jgi:hypothetical protein
MIDPDERQKAIDAALDALLALEPDQRVASCVAVAIETEPEPDFAAASLIHAGTMLAERCSPLHRLALARLLDSMARRLRGGGDGKADVERRH